MYVVRCSLAETIAYGSIAHSHNTTNQSIHRIETALIIVFDVMLTTVSVSFYSLFFLICSNWSTERVAARNCREKDRDGTKSTAKHERNVHFVSSMVRNEWQEWYTKDDRTLTYNLIDVVSIGALNFFPSSYLHASLLCGILPGCI